MSRWNSWSYDELVDVLSDYHKDVFGYRLRLNGKPKEVLIAHLDSLDEYMAKMQTTLEGRAHLQSQGWAV